MTASYDAGSVMVRVRRTGDAFKAESVFDMKNNEWNSEVHTPIVYKGHMFAVGKKKRGLFTCLSFDGKEVWTSEGKASFGLGSFLLADGMFFVLDGDTGKLRLIEASTTGTTNWPARRFWRGRKSGARWHCRTASSCCGT
jgi:hypothetical protein